MSIQLLSNNGKIFSTRIMPEIENLDPVKNIENKKKRLQALKNKAATKFRPVPTKILNLINRIGNMLQIATTSPSVTETKINQLLNQLSATIQSADATKEAGKGHSLPTEQSEKNMKVAEAKTSSEKIAQELKKRKSSSLLKNILETRLA
ncbi:hypothetical protein [Cedecea davisae]|uniref:hypothetical protein n=1 Tax=Cedecea davisae TaxID=158484 RepID=UPI002430EBA5|nr:hypothetical protein [Cedecea davisae]